jgi:hypothetical protein
MSHDDVLRRMGGGGTRATVRRILAVWADATPADREAGETFYPVAREHADTLATLAGVSRETAARAMADLSPRCGWGTNVRAAYALVTGSPIPRNVLSRNVACARATLGHADGPTMGGLKTESFTANILGDRRAVTIDAWACRVAGVDEKRIGLVGAYAAVTHAYRLAARRAGVDPVIMQAVTWHVVRSTPRAGRRAA